MPVYEPVPTGAASRLGQSLLGESARFQQQGVDLRLQRLGILQAKRDRILGALRNLQQMNEAQKQRDLQRSIARQNLFGGLAVDAAGAGIKLAAGGLGGIGGLFGGLGELGSEENPFFGEPSFEELFGTGVSDDTILEPSASFEPGTLTHPLGGEITVEA